MADEKQKIKSWWQRSSFWGAITTTALAVLQEVRGTPISGEHLTAIIAAWGAFAGSFAYPSAVVK